MSRFFIPSSQQDDDVCEREYLRLRGQAEACTGSVSSDRRIEEIECRRQGHDCLLRVGEPDAADGRTVAAILKLGRDTYTVHHLASEPGQATTPTVLQRTEVYSVADFD
ncbi:MAG TPA: hypothetical protein VK765_06360 [Solirubrobacteraceae bacterium]|jgi:hypothetical protein|nr:hypothetical protein [Solirubrobacteraceae bacterium]